MVIEVRMKCWRKEAVAEMAKRIGILCLESFGALDGR